MFNWLKNWFSGRWVSRSEHESVARQLSEDFVQAFKEKARHHDRQLAASRSTTAYYLGEVSEFGIHDIDEANNEVTVRVKIKDGCGVLFADTIESRYWSDLIGRKVARSIRYHFRKRLLESGG